MSRMGGDEASPPKKVSQRTFKILEVGENLKEIKSQKIKEKIIDIKCHNPMLISMNFFPEAKRRENCKTSLGQLDVL